jgi:DNA-binding FrmR family transcriptional regulator
VRIAPNELDTARQSGLQRMVENDDYCIDVLTQVSAAAASGDAEEGRLIDEATSAVERLVKS